MSVKAISAPVVIRRSFTLSTTTIRETQLDIGIRPAQAELAQMLKQTLSVATPLQQSGSPASAAGSSFSTQRWALSTSTGLSTFPVSAYVSGCFWFCGFLVNLSKVAAATIAMTTSKFGHGMDNGGVYVPNPPVIIAANTISLYDIEIDADTLSTSNAFAIEFIYQLIAVDSATLSALLARGDLFL